MGKKQEKNKKQKGAKSSRREGRKPRLAKSWKPRKDGAEAPTPEEKPWYKDVKVRGFGVQMGVVVGVKGRVLWA